MHLEAQPAGRARPAACGKNPAHRFGIERDPGVYTQVAAGRHEGLREAGIETVATDSEGWSRQRLGLHRAVALVPDDLAKTQGIVEERGNAELRHGRRVKGGDEFSANAVARIVESLEDGDRHSAAPQRQSQGEAGQAAADDFDRLGVAADHAGVRMRS